MGSFSDFWENEILDHVFGKGSYTPPTNIYIGLSTTTPTDAGGNISEPSGGSYARKSTASADWNVAASGALDNANMITFVEATGSWGTITHFALFDALTSGNMLAHCALGTSKPIDNGDTASFKVGELDLSLD